MFITRVKVINFRSLVNVDISLNSYTALVGLNDSGKSNLLRALNLFFNNQTDLDHPLIFNQDYSQNAKVTPKKAKQIEIEIEFTPPKNYKYKGQVIWKKTFRADSAQPNIDKIYRKDGGEFERNSKIAYWARHIAFEYIPAIRGKSYFSILKRRLYKTLAATVAPKLDGASRTFLLDLRKEVKKIESESQRLLQLQTEFALPKDLGQLFEALDFDAADHHVRTTLQYRGDGIQGRHIPIILKFLADQRKSLSAKGKPVPETIWGFEEPENNLELIKQMEMAKEFQENSKSIQILLSTHSPAFYSMGKKIGGVKVAVRANGSTSFENDFPAEGIDESLGLMPFIEPYLNQAINERKELIEQISSLKQDTLLKNKPCLYVEGATDKSILNAGFQALGLNKNFEIHAKPGNGGGVNWIKGYCIARAAMTDLSEKTGALFDDDQAGNIAAKEISKHTETIGRAGRIKTFFVGKKSSHNEIRLIKRSGINIPYSIEEICGESAWEYAESQGWLMGRDTLMQDNHHKVLPNETLNSAITRLITETRAQRVVNFKIDPKQKTAFASYVTKNMTAENISQTLKDLVLEIHTHFSKN
ncbi:MAG: hypothetical protein RLZZ601_241 [Pseudomonadota bacterium]